MLFQGLFKARANHERVVRKCETKLQDIYWEEKNESKSQTCDDEIVKIGVSYDNWAGEKAFVAMAHAQEWTQLLDTRWGKS